MKALFVMSDQRILLLSTSEIIWLVHEKHCYVILTELN
jgi:hypothetical protein